MTSSEDMACKELVEVITAYLEGTMPEHDRGRFEEHLTLCDACVVYLDQMRQTVAALGKLSEDAICDDDREKLVYLFRAWNGERQW